MNGNGKPFWQSRKFWMEVISAGAYLALALTRTVEFTSAEHMAIILGLAGIGIGAHTVSDVGHRIADVLGARLAARLGAEAAAPPASNPEPDEDDEDDEDDEEEEG
jgi:hypothetical protein